MLDIDDSKNMGNVLAQIDAPHYYAHFQTNAIHQSVTCLRNVMLVR